MKKKNLLAGRERELMEMAEEYEAAKAEGRTIYLDADDLADLADWYATRRKYELAAEVADYGLRLHPGNTALLVETAYLFLDTGHKEEAEKMLEQIAEETDEVKILRANLLLEEGKLEEVEEVLRNLEERDSLANIVDASYMYIDMGYPEKAICWLAYGTDKYADDEIYMAVSGDCYYAMGEFKLAISYFNRLIDKNPYSAPYWFGLARCYFDQSQFDKAIEACDYALVTDEDFPDPYLMKGHAFFQLGNEEEALACYRQAEKYGLVPQSFVASFIGLNQVARGEWKEGYENLEKAIEMVGSNEFALPSLYANAGLCLYKMGKVKKAHEYCRKASALAPYETEPYLVEGRIYMEEGNLEEGLKKWHEALEQAPDAETWHEIGLCSIDVGQLKYAKLAFEYVKELDPDFEGINEKLTALCMLLKNKEDFMKYNRLCKHPFEPEDMERMLQLLQKEEKGELAKMMQSILNALR